MLRGNDVKVFFATAKSKVSLESTAIPRFALLTAVLLSKYYHRIPLKNIHVSRLFYRFNSVLITAVWMENIFV